MRLQRFSERSGSRRYARGPRIARIARHLTALAAPALRRDRSAPGLARAAIASGPGSREAWRTAVDLRPRDRLARVRVSPALHFPAHARRTAARRFGRFPWADGAARTARLAARPHRLPDRRCRSAGALDDRLDAQPSADDRRLVARRRTCCSPGSTAPAGSGTRWSTPTSQTTRSAGNGRQAAAPTQPRTSASSIRSCRANGTTLRGAYLRRWRPNSRNCPTGAIHRPWDAPAEVLAQAGVALGQTYPRPIVELAASRDAALAAYASLREPVARTRS